MPDAEPLARAPGRRPPLGTVPLEAATPQGRSGDHEEEAERLARLLVAAPLVGLLDAGGVRVQHGPRSAVLAAAYGADAVTIGREVHLAAGHPPLGSPAGRLLVAHELVHAWQQTTGRAAYGVPQARARRRKARTGSRFTVAVDREMGPEELLRTFVRQYYRLERPQDVERVAARSHWTPQPRSATAADAHRGHVSITVYQDPADRDVAALSKADRDAVNAEADRRFFEETGLPPETRLGGSPADAELRARWRGVRANLLAEQAQVRELRALPEDIQKILFAGGRTLTPDEYGPALELAARFARLSPADRARYLATVDASSADLADLEASLQHFELSLRMREWDEEAYDEAAAPLFGMEDLYTLWKEKRHAETMATYGPALEAASTVSLSTAGLTGDPGHWLRERDDAERRFRAALARSPFKTEAELVAAVNGFLRRFRTQTVNLAMDVLAGYDHQLYVARLKFRDTDAAQRLVQAIASTGAAVDYAAAKEAESTAYLASQPLYDDLPGRGQRLYPGDPVALRAEATSLRGTASAKVVAASDHEPIVDPTGIGRKTDRERLAGATPEEARSYLLEVIDDRLKDAARVRAELEEDPERVFSQSALVQASLQQQSIDADSIYGTIVADHLEEIRDAHLFSAIVIGLIALILAALVPVGGWVAAAALVANAGISTWQAIDALAEYNRGESEYALGFISDEPSLFWVGVAVVGAAFDLGMTAAQLFKAAAPALLRLRKPLTEFALAEDAETAASRLKALNEQIDAALDLQKEVRDALKAHAAAELAMREALTGGGKLRAAVTPLDPVFEALYFFARKSGASVTALRKEKQLIAAFTRITGLEGAGLQELTTAFQRVRKAIRAGERVGMDEATLLTYVDRLAGEHAAGEDVFAATLKEMRGWRPPTLEQVQAGTRLTQAHQDLYALRSEKASLEGELTARRAGRLPGSRERMDEISERLEELTGASEKRGVPPRRGEIDEAVSRFDEAMRLAEQAKLDPKLLMRSAFAASPERQAVLDAAHGVDQVGGLLKPPSGVHPDHIVSLQRITEMEGFDKLRLAERRTLAVRADNLVAMDTKANLSKGGRSWAMWDQAGTFYPASTIEHMKTLEADLYGQVQEWILKRVAGR